MDLFGSEYVLGIDLGTSNTAAVAAGPSPDPVSIFNTRYGPYIPSIVSYRNPNAPVPGWAAKGLLLTDPLTTIYGWKRFIGRTETNEFVARNRDRFPFRIHTDPKGELGAVIGGSIVSFVDVAALILEEVRTQARAVLQTDVTRVVIAVPAHFGTAQRRAVREAARRAGLAVLRLVDEPIASALSYSAGQNLHRRLLIYDLGGGTFDATMLDVQNEVFDVRAAHGDSFLGGLDFDRAIMERLAKHVREQYGFDPREEPIVAQRLLDAAEYAKCQLSERTESRINVPMIGVDQRGNQIGVDYLLRRDELERLTVPMVERTIGLVDEMMAGSGLSRSDVQKLVLVGGQARMPLIRERLSRSFGVAPSYPAAGDVAVAHGAALVAASEQSIAGVVVFNVLSMPIGAFLPGGRTEIVFPRSARLPAEARLPLEPSPEGRVLGLFESTDLTSSDRTVLGLVRIPPLALAQGGRLWLSLSDALELAARLETPSGMIPLAVDRPAKG